MKTLIIALYPYQGQGLDAWHDHGAGMTFTSAKNAGCDVHFLDMKTLRNDQELKTALKGFDLISFGLKSSYYSLGMKVIKIAKELGSKTLVAGYHVTAAPEQLLENPDIDYVFHGESEITFPIFLKASHLFNREIFGEKPQNLDSLPFFDRSIYANPTEPVTGWWHGPNRHKMISVMAARGCPYKCGFCQPIENNHFGKKLRRRSVDSMIKEMLWLKDLYHPDCLMIHDDTFLIQPKWLEEFVDKYPQVGLPFWAAGRADGICEHPELVNKLIKVGWELVSVGFESGSQRILDLINKETTVEQNLEAAKIIHSNGAKIYANYMIGLPQETKQDIQATAKMADLIRAEMPSWAFFTPYPGCDLGEQCIKNGLSLLDREHYDRCPSGKKVKGVDYDYLNAILRGYREDFRPPFTCDIIIPAYENEELSLKCLESIKKYTDLNTYRVIFIDNASKDSSKVENFLSTMPSLFHKMDKNEGFVLAVNKGIELSSAPYVCLLNNDTEVSNNWLNKLITALKTDPKLGIVGPLTMPDLRGKGMMDSHHSLSLHNTLLPADLMKADKETINNALEQRYTGKIYTPSFVAFLCAVIKREVINKVGLLDINYKMGMWDDNDYNLSTRKLGYKCELALDTCIYHRGRSTFSKIQAEEGFDVDKLLQENSCYMANKWSLGSVTFKNVPNKTLKTNIKVDPKRSF